MDLLDGLVVVVVLEEVIMIPLLLVEVEVLVGLMLVEVMDPKQLVMLAFSDHMDYLIPVVAVVHA